MSGSHEWLIRDIPDGLPMKWVTNNEGELLIGDKSDYSLD